MRKTPGFDAAADFLAAQARVLDKRMFQRLFADGAAGSGPPGSCGTGSRR